MGKAPVAKREKQGAKDNGKGAAKTGITFTHADEVISRLKNTAAMLQSGHHEYLMRRL